MPSTKVFATCTLYMTFFSAALLGVDLACLCRLKSGEWDDSAVFDTAFLCVFRSPLSIPTADTRVDRGLAQAIQQARLGKKMTQKQLATVRRGEKFFCRGPNQAASCFVSVNK